MEVARVQRSAGWLLTVVSAAAISSSTGCKTTGQMMSAMRPSDEPAKIDGIMGPTERRLQAQAWEQRRQQLQNSGLKVEGIAEYDAAQKLYDDGKYRDAEKAFHALAKQRAKLGKSTWDQWKELFSPDKEAAKGLFGSYGDPIEEDALFMTAECQFAQQGYPTAQDSYGTLLEKYPSTRHLDDVTRRLFFIAQTWLGVPPTKGKVTDVQLVAHAEEGRPEPAVKPLDGPSNWPIVPNFTDRTEPLFDTQGRALQALESIWRHDATGPLADDALMLQATYYQRKGDYVEAARLYKLVREQYPDSTHFQNAYLLGSHVTLASYDGAEYEAGPLGEARQLKETSRQLFPGLTAEQKSRLDAELKAIANEEVEREWAKVEFYLRKNQPTSVALYCNRILHKYPESKYAKQAAETLEKVRAKLTPEEAAVFVGTAPPVDKEQGKPSGRAIYNPTPTKEAEPVEPPVSPAAPGTDWWNSTRQPQPTEKAPDLKPVEPEQPKSPGDEAPGRLQLLGG